LQTFDLSHAFLPLTVAKLSMFKNGPVFLAHPVIVWLYVVFIDSLGLPFLSSKHEDKPTTETEAGFALLSL